MCATALLSKKQHTHTHTFGARYVATLLNASTSLSHSFGIPNASKAQGRRVEYERERDEGRAQGDAVPRSDAGTGHCVILTLRLSPLLSHLCRLASADGKLRSGGGEGHTQLVLASTQWYKSFALPYVWICADLCEFLVVVFVESLPGFKSINMLFACCSTVSTALHVVVALSPSTDTSTPHLSLFSTSSSIFALPP